jgi:hypothetical protein
MNCDLFKMTHTCLNMNYYYYKSVFDSTLASHIHTCHSVYKYSVCRTLTVVRPPVQLESSRVVAGDIVMGLEPHNHVTGIEHKTGNRRLVKWPYV